APTFCPECRMQRRFSYRNERALYKRNCSLCGKSMIGAYPAKTKFPVYCFECWWSDKWDSIDYSKDYDLAKPFFLQWKELQDKVPRPYINNTVGPAMINSEYTNCAGEMKNCYLVYGAQRDEDCAYSHYLNESRYCFDNLYSIKNENCYECVDIENCYNLQYSESCLNCLDSYFLFDCRNCNNCIGCVGLRNAQYHILNQPYSKNDYLKAKEDLTLDTRSGITSFREKYKSIYYSSPRKYYHGQMNNNFSGDYIANTENTHQSFYIKNARGCKFIFWCNNAQDVYDYMSWGDIEFSYECVSVGYKSYHCLFSDASWADDKNLEYCSLCFSSSDLFGCIGMRKKQYCILNKQYSKEEYEILRENIIKDMTINPYRDTRGVSYSYGEFFPIEFSPFLYKDTAAHEHFPLADEQIKGNGFRWEEAESRNYKITISAENLPDSIQEVKDNILQEVIGCAHSAKCNHQCTEAFKITNAELQFYRRMKIPLPQICYNCRHAERVKLRNPLRLWNRTCTKCGKEIKTSYALDRKEMVYCEQCYNIEVA
ncbi:MAG: hypothetical protein NT094_02740, partial [Candidatus Staskawiczbacteria bacterium]|nr:hypothetical protein [Candidatus Staskawiczbacteria bacterium]